MSLIRYLLKSLRGSARRRENHSKPSFCIQLGARFVVPATKSKEIPMPMLKGISSTSLYLKIKRSCLGAPRLTKRISGRDLLIMEQILSISLGSVSNPNGGEYVLLILIFGQRLSIADLALSATFDRPPRKKSRCPFSAANWQTAGNRSDPATLSLSGVPKNLAAQSRGTPSGTARAACLYIFLKSESACKVIKWSTLGVTIKEGFLFSIRLSILLRVSWNVTLSMSIPSRLILSRVGTAKSV